LHNFIFNTILRKEIIMAKVKQQELNGAGEVVEKAPKTPKAPKAPKVKTRNVKKFIFQNEPPEGVKIAPQCVIIIGYIKEAGPEGITMPNLVEKLKADEKFVTRQPHERVVTFYVPAMKERNIITVETTKIEVAPDAQADAQADAA
jgi:hypothetical protein